VPANPTAVPGLPGDFGPITVLWASVSSIWTKRNLERVIAKVSFNLIRHNAKFKKIVSTGKKKKKKAKTQSNISPQEASLCFP
jgi:hypothetical protein